MNKVRPTKLTTLQQHLLFWTVYTLYFYMVNVLGNDEVTIGLVLLSIPYFAFVFYTVLYILQRFLSCGQWLRCILALFIFYSISSVLVWILTHANWVGSLLYGTYMVSDYVFSWREFVQTLMVMHLQFSLFAFVYFYYRGKLAEEQQTVAEMERRLAVEEEKQHYEYVALAAQVSPHMMANIFQGWSSQLEKIAPLVARQMMSVYGLMKFYMQAHMPEGPVTILLQDEIKAVTCFVEAQRDVLGREVCVRWDIKGNLYRFVIPPTTILTLVENAFKHGDVYCADNPLLLSVEAGWSHYSIQVSNSKLGGNPLLHSHGQGLRNIQKRLAIVFGECARLHIKDAEQMFAVELLVDTRINERGIT